MNLYPINVHPLPPETRYVRVSLPDGTVWAIPSSAVVAAAARYYEAEGWDDETDPDFSGKQPTGDELIGIIWTNADLAQEAMECRWSSLAEGRVLLAGPGTIPPGDDKLWWFHRYGGEVVEMTTLTLPEQVARCGRLLSFDDAAKAYFEREEAERRNELELLRWFRGAEAKA